MLVLSGLIGAVVLLLAVPVELEFQFQGIEPLAGQVGIRWLFGLVRIHVPVPAPATPAPAEDRGRKAAPGPRPKGSGRRPHVLAALRQAEFRSRVYRLVREIVRAVHLHRLRLLLRLGLGDPADTGRLWAAVGPLHALALSRGWDLRIEPDFGDPVLEFRADGRAWLVPLRLLFLAIAFALSPSAIRAWRAMGVGHA